MDGSYSIPSSARNRPVYRARQADSAPRAEPTSSIGDRALSFVSIVGDVGLYAYAIVKRVALIVYDVLKILAAIVTLNGKLLKESVLELGRNIVHLVMHDILFGAVWLVVIVVMRIASIFAFGTSGNMARRFNNQFPTITKDVLGRFSSPKSAFEGARGSYLESYLFADTQ